MRLNPSLRHRLAMLLLALPAALTSLVCGADTGVPNTGSGPVEVRVDIYLLDLDGIDSAAQSFQANVYFEARWSDPALPMRREPAR